MKNDIQTTCGEIRHGTQEYDQTVALRDEVLREPLGLEFNAEELAAERDSIHLACWRGGMLVACLVLKPLPGREVCMRQLAVRRDVRGKDLGQTLVKYAESRARSHGFETVVLHARETAVGFYEKAGYEPEGGHFIEVTIPHVSMRKNLAAGGDHVPGPCR